MESEMMWLWALASGIALWFARDAFRWVRAGLHGAPDCGGREIEPGTAYRRAAIKVAAALTEREWYRSLGQPST